MKNPKILVFSHKDFNKFCKENNFNDYNVDNETDYAFISIINTEECQKLLKTTDEEHWFKEPHNNVLNLEFEDITDNDKRLDEYGEYLTLFDSEMASKIIDFVEEHLGKTLVIHCKAGRSRSQAVFRFITDYYDDVYGKDCGRADNPCITPNYFVVKILRETYLDRCEKTINMMKNN